MSRLIKFLQENDKVMFNHDKIKHLEHLIERNNQMIAKLSKEKSTTEIVNKIRERKERNNHYREAINAINGGKKFKINMSDYKH